VKYLEENFVKVFVTNIRDESKDMEMRLRSTFVEVDIEMTHIQSDGLMF
jgi:hypothetical protein